MNFKIASLKFSVRFLLLVLLPFTGYAHANDKPHVVASFSIMGDLVGEIAGDKVELTTLVGANEDAHMFQPSPADARLVATADLLVINGLGFEGWMTRLQESTDFKGLNVVASQGIAALKSADEHQQEEGDHHGEGAHHNEDHHDEEHHHEDHHKEHDEHATHEDEHEDEHHHDHGEFDPHAWNSVANVKIYVKNISKALRKTDPDNAAYYFQQASNYLNQLNELEQWIKAEVARIPAERRQVITSHDAFGYLAHAYGLEFHAPQGFSTESEASAADIAAIIRQVKSEQISAVFVENVSDPRLIRQIANETGAKLGGTLYSDALSGVDEPASTYIKMMRHNISTLVTALGR